MQRNRFSKEQVSGILKEHEEGLGAKDLCRKHGVSDAALYKWRSRQGVRHAAPSVVQDGLNTGRFV